MLKILTVIVAICSVTLSSAQNSSDRLKIVPRWEVGNAKQVRVEQHTKVRFDDSLVQNDLSSYDVRLKVIENNSTYTLSWSSQNFNKMLLFTLQEAVLDPYKNQLAKSLAAAEKEIVQTELSLQMDKSTGEIREWLNGKELLKNAEYHEKKVIKAWGAEHHVSKDSIMDLQLDFSKKLSAAYQIWHTTLLKEANVFFESYNQSFLLNQTLSEKVLSKNMLNQKEREIEFPGMLTCDATEVNNRLILDKKIEYDKEFLTLYLIGLGDSFSDLALTDVMVFEKEQTIFDLKSTWIVNYSKKLYFEVKGMKTTTSKTITFLPIQ